MNSAISLSEASYIDQFDQESTLNNTRVIQLIDSLLPNLIPQEKLVSILGFLRAVEYVEQSSKTGFVTYHLSPHGNFFKIKCGTDQKIST